MVPPPCIALARSLQTPSSTLKPKTQLGHVPRPQGPGTLSVAAGLSYRNYTNVTRHTTTTCQGHVFMVSLTPTGHVGGKQGTSERASCVLLTMGREPHPLILVWFTLFFCHFCAESWTSGRFLYPPIGTQDNGRYSMVRIGMEGILSFCGTGLGQPHHRISCLSIVHGMDLDWPVLGLAEIIKLRSDNVLVPCNQSVSCLPTVHRASPGRRIPTRRGLLKT